MTKVEVREAYVEHPVFFPGAGVSLFGVLTRPTGAANGVTVVPLTGGGYITSTHRNRLHVRLARLLAAQGYHSFRFDYHGTGESAGTVDQFRLDEPFLADVSGALSWLRGAGLDRQVLVGSCFGARTALAAAAESVDVEAAVLMTPPVRDFRWDEAAQRYAPVDAATGSDGSGMAVSPGLLEPLERLAGRGVRVLFVYGQDEAAWADFQAARSGKLGRIVDGAQGRVTVRAIPGSVHQFTSLHIQQAVLDVTVGWLCPATPVGPRDTDNGSAALGETDDVPVKEGEL